MIDVNMTFSDMEVLVKMIIFHLLFEATKETGVHLDLGVQFNQLKPSYFQVCRVMRGKFGHFLCCLVFDQIETIINDIFTSATM